MFHTTPFGGDKKNRDMHPLLASWEARHSQVTKLLRSHDEKSLSPIEAAADEAHAAARVLQRGARRWLKAHGSEIAGALQTVVGEESYDEYYQWYQIAHYLYDEMPQEVKEHFFALVGIFSSALILVTLMLVRVTFHPVQTAAGVRAGGQRGLCFMRVLVTIPD